MDIKVTELNPHPLNSKIYAVANIAELAEDIQKSGWIKPLTVVRENNAFTIVSGHRRHQAAISLNLDVVPCEVVEFEHDWQILERLLLENQYRQKDNATKLREYPFQKQIEAERAKVRQSQLNGKTLLKENFPEATNKGQSRDKAAETVGIGSGKTAEKGIKVIQAADALRESGEVVKADLLIASVNKSYDGAAKLLEVIDEIDEKTAEEFEDKIATNKTTVSKVIKELKKEQRKQDIEKQKQDIASQNLPEINSKFDVLVFDPPWPYGREYDPEGSRVANPYPEMSIQEIKNINVPDKENSIMFLWTTHQFLPDAFEILKDWGYSYKATMVWNKEKIGMGYWLRMQCEFCLLAVKGKPIWDITDWRDIFSEPRREHSRKPDSFFQAIDKYFSYASKLEYFSREKREGWSVYGNDINKF